MQGQIGEIFDLVFFADKLRKRRKEEGITLKDFAARIGVALPTYQHYEGGKRKPPVDFVIMLARATGLATDYWLGLSNNNMKNDSPNCSTIAATAKLITGLRTFRKEIEASIAKANTFLESINKLEAKLGGGE